MPARASQPTQDLDDLEPLAAQIIEAALGERPPIDLVIQARQAGGGAINTKDVHRLEENVRKRLAQEGIVPCRQVSGRVPRLKRPISKTIYYRPSERLLEEAIADSHPILLATCVESQRYLDALVERGRDPEDRRQVWIWRGAAGMDVLERMDETTGAPHGIGFARVSGFDDPSPTTLARAKREFMEQGGAEGVIQSVRGRVRFWWKPVEEGVLVVLVDDRRIEPEDDWDAIQRDITIAVAEAASADPELRRTDTRPTEGFVGMLLLARRLPARSVVVVPDAHHFLAYERNSMQADTALRNIGALKDAYHRLLAKDQGVKIALLCADVALPKDLREEVLRLELPLPSRRELFVQIRTKLGPDVDDEKIVRLSDEAAGMTLAEVAAVLSRAPVGEGDEPHRRRLDALRQAKRRHIARSPALELVEEGAAVELGGMDRFMAWLAVRRRAFTEPELAARAGINRPPRGVLLLGIPGSGKSLAAKAIASDWKLPLVRMDMGALRDVWVGSSEARVREALRVIEAMAPCVMWIDEIDKGMAQEAHAGSADMNIRATLLTWMQENRFPVFIVATANRFAALPPELTRAGRFDARVFFGCPGGEGRRRILEIHLRSRGYDPAAFGLGELVDLTHGFTGAEIEQVVLDALYVAFDSGKALSQEMLVHRASETQPIIKSAGTGLEEVWDLVDAGRVEMASDEMLTRTQVARLIDPDLYRPIYCRMEEIEGFKRHHSRANRFCMASPYGGPAAVVLSTGEPDWIYVQTNFRRDPTDIGDFKFLDRFETLEKNFVFDTLVVDHALETILFETEDLRRRFEASSMLSAYAELFKDLGDDR